MLDMVAVKKNDNVCGIHSCGRRGVKWKSWCTRGFQGSRYDIAARHDEIAITALFWFPVNDFLLFLM
jgi:hypothetical protein